MFPSPFRHSRWCAAGLALVASTASLVTADSPPTAPRLGVQREGVVLFTGAGDRWLWTHAVGGRETLYEGGPNRAPRSLATGLGWTGLAADNSHIWLIQRYRRYASLLQVDGVAPAVPKTVLTGLDAPSGLLASEGRLYWLENRAPDAALFSYLPTTGWTALLRTRDAGGSVHTLTEWPGGGPRGELSASGDLIGVAKDQLYLRVRRPASTEFVRVSLPGGKPTRIAVERGLQTGALDGARFCWTAPSDEASANASLRCVRALDAQGKPETLGDWLPGDGAPVSLSGKLLHVGASVHRISRGAAPGIWLANLPHGQYGHDTRRLVRFSGAAPAVFPVKGL